MMATSVYSLINPLKGVRSSTSADFKGRADIISTHNGGSVSGSTNIDDFSAFLGGITMTIDRDNKSGVAYDIGHKYYHTRIQYAIEIIQQAIKTGNYRLIWKLL
jgi:hypothetical protein